MSDIPLPPYIDRDAWLGFCEMRRKIKKPLTHRAAVLALKELQIIKDAGHCPNAALDQSTFMDWAGLWPLKDKEIQRATSNTGRELAAMRQHDEALRVNPVDARKVVDMLGAVKVKLTRNRC